MNGPGASTPDTSTQTTSGPDTSGKDTAGKDAAGKDTAAAGAAGNGRHKPPPHFACHVFRTEDLFVQIGANLGDAIGDADEVCEGDIYNLEPDAVAWRLYLLPDAGNTGRGLTVAPGSEVGTPGDPVTLSSRLTLIAPDGDTVEMLMLRHRTQGRTSMSEAFALPLSPIAPRTDYTLVRANSNPGEARLADIVCISFARGTRIALADGRQVRIEQLEIGDRVLTRDHGGQPLRWMGQATLRAVGSFAPVVISSGTLGNAGDLIVGQHHRMFLYQRERDRVTDTAELLVQAKHLVDGDRVFLREGGFVDYFSLVFDRHEIIYAEGIPAESLMVNDATLTHLPDDLATEVRARFPGLDQNQHFGTEAGRRMLDEIGAGRLFQKGRRQG
ncbi:Hint domain-containing protein [Acidimangrovimonas sediminis]|uniref:Hint domain-containing protein n=1 Tax=Acidimangrovimonas sediminis TaxID=2056283 RepID=UPI000C7FB530|nr:Hint domain-containing protein [Acidimangrovimonas sediminis]